MNLPRALKHNVQAHYDVLSKGIEPGIVKGGMSHLLPRQRHVMGTQTISDKICNIDDEAKVNCGRNGIVTPVKSRNYSLAYSSKKPSKFKNILQKIVSYGSLVVCGISLVGIVVATSFGIANPSLWSTLGTVVTALTSGAGISYVAHRIANPPANWPKSFFVKKPSRLEKFCKYSGYIVNALIVGLGITSFALKIAPVGLVPSIATSALTGVAIATRIALQFVEYKCKKGRLVSELRGSTKSGVRCMRSKQCEKVRMKKKQVDLKKNEQIKTNLAKSKSMASMAEKERLHSKLRDLDTKAFYYL